MPRQSSGKGKMGLYGRSIDPVLALPLLGVAAPTDSCDSFEDHSIVLFSGVTEVIFISTDGPRRVFPAAVLDDSQP